MKHWRLRDNSNQHERGGYISTKYAERRGTPMGCHLAKMALKAEGETEKFEKTSDSIVQSNVDQITIMDFKDMQVIDEKVKKNGAVIIGRTLDHKIDTYVNCLNGKILAIDGEEPVDLEIVYDEFTARVELWATMTFPEFMMPDCQSLEYELRPPMNPEDGTHTPLDFTFSKPALENLNRTLAICNRSAA